MRRPVRKALALALRGVRRANPVGKLSQALAPTDSTLQADALALMRLGLPHRQGSYSDVMKHLRINGAALMRAVAVLSQELAPHGDAIDRDTAERLLTRLLGEHATASQPLAEPEHFVHPRVPRPKGWDDDFVREDKRIRDRVARADMLPQGAFVRRTS